MLKRYKNRFLEEIQRAGLDPSDFSGEEGLSDGRPSFSVYYRPGQLLFVASNPVDDHGYFDYHYSLFTGTTPKMEGSPIDEICSFDVVIRGFGKWLNHHVMVAIEEQLIPDFW